MKKTKIKKREIWLSEYFWSEDWNPCARHFSKKAATKSAEECAIESGFKHRVRKKPK